MTCINAQISYSIDGREIANITISDELIFSGRASLFSTYHNVAFADISVTPAGIPVYTERIDALDRRITYFGNWKFNTMGSFMFHNRTCAENDGKVFFEVRGTRTAAAVIALSEGAVISVESDGRLIADKVSVRNTVHRATLWHSFELENADILLVTVHEGKVTLDTVETI